jgi:diacylglycerol kinase (ATP)
MEKHIALVCNPTAENAKSVRMAEEIGLQLRNRAVQFSAFTTHWPTVWEGFTDVWIVGGDGTANWFINENPGIQLPLSVFPGGTGNDFQWMLYGDIHIHHQVEQVLNGQKIWIDAGVCNERLFLNGVGIGFDGAIVKDLLGKKKLAGKASYLLSIMKNILRYQEADCTAATDNEIIRQRSFLISVANGKRYGGGFHVAPKAHLSDGLLDLSMIGSINPLMRMRYLPMMEKGEHLDLPFVQYRQTPHVVVEASREVPAHLDGEYFSAKTFRIETLPKRFLFSL